MRGPSNHDVALPDTNSLILGYIKIYTLALFDFLPYIKVGVWGTNRDIRIYLCVYMYISFYFDHYSPNGEIRSNTH